MSDLSTWKMSYSVGNRTLDEQHKKLLSLCNLISECEQQDTRESIENFHAILNDLALYAKTHFQTEEEILKQANYPGLDEQIAEHEAYRDTLTDFLVAAMSGMIDKSGLAHYLEAWWIEHILESDMHYKSFLTRAG